MPSPGGGYSPATAGALSTRGAGWPVIIVAHSGSPAFSPTRAGGTHSTDPGHGHRSSSSTTRSHWPQGTVPVACCDERPRRLSGCRLPGRWIVTAARCRRPEPAARPGAASAGTRAHRGPGRILTPERIDRLPPGRGDRRSRPHPETGVGGSSAPIHFRRMGRATTTAADRRRLSADPADLSRRPRQWLRPRVAPDDLRLNNQTYSMNTQGGPRCFVPR